MNKQTSSPCVAIIGAGASGLATSIFLAQKNIKTTIYEKNNKIGKKLLATGNGKCNVTNKNISLDNFHTSYYDKKALKKILNSFQFKECQKFFSNLGVEFLSKENGRVYPMSSSSASIVDALTFQTKYLGTKIVLNTLVESLEYKDNQFLINKKDKFDIVILATGSAAMAKLGGTYSGYKLAETFKHTIIPLQPSLVQLVAEDKNLDMISGVKLTGTVKNHTGDILFTKYGISGSAILDISKEIALELQYKDKINITIDIAPAFSKEKLKSMLQQRVKTQGARKISFWLDGIFHKKISQYLIYIAKLPSYIQYGKQLSTKDINKLVHFIKSLPFTIIDTKGFDYCEVCSGGVDLCDINLSTMESKKQKGLYLIGEVLDVDGDCGGYNLHFAWASAYVTTQAIKKLIQ